MKLEIPLTEIKSILKNNYTIEVDLHQKTFNIIEINTFYLLLKLEIKEVKKHELTLKYGPNSFSSKVKFLLFKENIDNKLDQINNDMIQLDKKNSEIKIDLTKVDQLKTMLNKLYIYDLSFDNENIILKLKFN